MRSSEIENKKSVGGVSAESLAGPSTQATYADAEYARERRRTEPKSDTYRDLREVTAATTAPASASYVLAKRASQADGAAKAEPQTAVPQTCVVVVPNINGRQIVALANVVDQHRGQSIEARAQNTLSIRDAQRREGPAGQLQQILNDGAADQKLRRTDEAEALRSAIDRLKVPEAPATQPALGSLARITAWLDGEQPLAQEPAAINLPYSVVIVVQNANNDASGGGGWGGGGAGGTLMAAPTAPARGMSRQGPTTREADASKAVAQPTK